VSTRLELLDGAPVARYDDTARTVTTYGPTGQVTNTRPYTPAENAAADAHAAASAAQDAARARDELADAVLDATAALMEDAHTDGAAWVQPTGAHNAYALGATVTHNGKTWENLTPANVWQSGNTADPRRILDNAADRPSPPATPKRGTSPPSSPPPPPHGRS
jgi:poly-gamma-glutamate capsule biosynthesis protein CapA/YwtB (metallophosphatase superfamily)